MYPNRVVDTSGVIVYSGTFPQCLQYILDADLPEGLRVEEVSCDDGEREETPFDTQFEDFSCVEEASCDDGEDEEPPFDTGFEDLSCVEDYAGPPIHPCPTCGAANRLTVADVNLGYQCDDCADAEGRGYL